MERINELAVENTLLKKRIRNLEEAIVQGNKDKEEESAKIKEIINRLETKNKQLQNEKEQMASKIKRANECIQDFQTECLKMTDKLEKKTGVEQRLVNMVKELDNTRIENNLLIERVVNMSTETNMTCRHYINNKCRFGLNCKFAHPTKYSGHQNNNE